MSPLGSPLFRAIKTLILKIVERASRGRSPRSPREPKLAKLRRALTNPDPINILHDPVDAEVDIVAVHGLGSSVETTWTHKGTDQLWLRDFLHLDFPKARIMTFRHNSNWESRALMKDLTDHGRQLLGALEGKRATDELRDRPLILIGHSFGGLLIEKALVLAKGATAGDDNRARHESLASSLAGAVFLGTPHAGSSYSSLGKLYCLLHYWEGANPLLLGYMDPGSKEILELEDEFLKYYRDLSFDFYETKPNIVLGIQFQMVVTRDAGTRRGQEAAPLDTDHFGLNKYSDRGDASYVAVKEKLTEMLRSWTDHMQKERDALDASELELLKDLEPYSFTTTAENRQRNLTPGTCEWMVHDAQFRTWGPRNTVLWIIGNPGSGKTYIAQWLCDYLEKKNTHNLMYFFFDAKNEDTKDLRSLEKFYQTILHQLLQRIRKTRPKLKAQCFKLVRKILLRDGPGKSSYVKALREVLSLAQPSFLVVDALDECKETDIEVLNEWLAKIRGLPNLQIAITTRPLETTKKLYECPSYIQLQLSSVLNRLDEDIEKYITGRIEKGAAFRAEMPRVVARLKARSSGMILYARLMLDILENKVGSEDAKLNEMEMLPKGLTALYADRLKNIKDKEFASRMLQWLVTCRRPLTVDGLRGVDIIGRTVWPNERFELDVENPPEGLGENRSGEDIFQVCLLRDLLPLVEILEDKTVRLVHTTVSQFLLNEKVEEDGVQCPSSFTVDLEDSHEQIAMTCVTYLRWNFGLNGAHKPDLLAFLDNKDVREYAILEWPDHCVKSEAKIMANGRESGALMDFLDGQRAFPAWLAARADLDSLFRAHFGLYGANPILPRPLHVAVYFNIWQFGRQFLPSSDVNTLDATGSTALHIAAGQGYLLIVKELLERNARMDLADASGASPLHRAVRRGNHEALSQLMSGEEGRAVVNIPDKYKFTPIHVACQLGWTQCVDVLHQHGASLSNDSGAIETPIGLAIENGHIDVVRKLLQANPALINHCCKPLIQAARRGLTEMVGFLCSTGIDTSYKDLLGQTALHKACIFGSKDLVTRLLDRKGTLVDAKDKSDRTPLYFAAERGHLDVVNCLLEHGANPNSLDRRKETVLFKPAGNGHIKVVYCLLKANTDATILDEWKRTPLRFAAMKGHAEIVRMLLERTQIKQDLPDWVGRTVLHNAAAWLRDGQEGVIDILFRHGARPDSVDTTGGTALHAAIARERGQPPPTDALLNRLIQRGVSVNAQDQNGRTALLFAAAYENLRAVQLLFTAGAAPRNQSLHFAVRSGRKALVQLFLDQKSNLELAERDWHGNTPLHLAASNGDTEIVSALLSAGAPTRCLNMNRQTPLGVVDRTQHPVTLKLLLDADPTPEGELEYRVAPDSSEVNRKDDLGRTALHRAALLGRLEVVQQLLKAQASTEVKDQIYQTPLHLASQRRDPATAEALIMANANVDATDAWGKTPLYLAAEAGNIAETQMLLVAEAEFVASSEKRTPLHAAALGGSDQTVRTLLGTEKGRRLISTQDIEQKTALHLAAERGYGNVVRELLRHTKDVAVIDMQDNQKRTALFLGSGNGHLEVVRQLIQAGSIVYRTDEHRYMAVHLAAEKGHVEIVNLLLDELPSQVEFAMKKWKEALPYFPREEDYRDPALLYALSKAGGIAKDAVGPYWSAVSARWATSEEQERLQRDVVSGLRSFDEESHSIPSTTLMQAVQGGHTEVIKLLLKKVPEMPLQAQHYSSYNALSLAASRGHTEIAQLLIAAGSEVNAITDSQKTSLHEAAEGGHNDVVELLLQSGANPDLVRLRDGSSPLHLAAKGGHEAAARALVRVAFVNAADDLGFTPLHVACLGGHDAVVEVLVDADADLSARDLERRTPLELVDGLDKKTRAHMEEQAKKQRQRRAAGH